VLDFGCGVGRILRHAAPGNPDGEFWGCDIDGPSIDWLKDNLPRVQVLRNAEWPPLPIDDEQFDLIWTFSVFTHLTDAWSAWLVELHRLLKPGGVLVATIFGPGHTKFVEEPIDEEIIGMNVLYPGASWDLGGPLVLHSRWWLEAHWGRAFEILDFHAGHPDGRPPLFGQSALVMRKRAGSPTTRELEAPETGEEREWAALRQNIASLSREGIELNRRLRVAYSSKSWKLTAPLRAAADLARRRTR
jgi:SAM-dependent methyltransferase